MGAGVEVLEALGSSPRARGTVAPMTPARLLARFIPACAGNGASSRSSRVRVTVHPRVRGERPYLPSSPEGKAGSSPRARGTANFRLHHGHSARFIPACAGNGGTR